MNVFGVEHDVIAKADALGSPESMHAMAHARGEHEGKTFRRCPKCSEGAFKTAARTVATTAEKIAVNKGLFGMGRKGAKAAEGAFDASKVRFKPIKQGVKPTGPGSERARMDPRAWESQTAAAQRSSSTKKRKAS